MNNIKHYLLAFLLLKMIGLNAQTFVDASATGQNDGTSWANAYTDLNNAITNAAANEELWVAAGKYSPGATTADHFLLTVDVQLFGGFNGTETMRSQRDYQTNLTILSGDVLNDDVSGDFTQYKADNNLHVVWCQTNITNNTVIDGFIVEGGNSLDVNGTGDDRRGGGILSYGSPIVQNCTFRDNYAYFGGGVYPRTATSSDTKILNCIFDGNSGGYGSAILVAFGDALIEDCIIRNNYSEEGAAVNGITGSSTIRRCDFTGNSGGLFGGSAYLVYQTTPAAPVKVLIEDSSFDQNTTLDIGGAMGIWDVDVIVTINRSTFSGNVGTVGAGAIFCNGNASLHLNNCSFLNNIAPQGGAILFQDSCVVTVDSCLFEGNESFGSTAGGAAFAIFNSANTSIKNSTFRNNKSNAGSCIYSLLYGGVDYALNIENSYFTGNETTDDGGVFNLTNTDLSLTNCLVADNEATIGSAIFANAVGLNQTIELTNTTIADNTGAEAIANNAINGGASSLVLLNTILENPTAGNYLELTTDANVVSNGGNLSSDGSLTSALTSTNDLNNTSASFVDVAAGDYQLSIASLCIDQGIDTGAPLLDIENNMRFGVTDMGAYEYQGFLNNEPITKEDTGIRIFPNPVASTLNFTLENEVTGLLEIAVFDMGGAMIFKEEVNKSTKQVGYTINVADLPAGAYQLSIVAGGKGKVNTFVKE